MIRFVLRLVGALLVEKLLRDKRRPTYFHGIRIHPRNTIPTSGAKYALLEHPSARDWFEDECMVGVSGTTSEGVTMHFTSTDSDPYKPTLCTLDENGNPNPLWRWCYLPAFRVRELEGKRGMNGPDETTATA